MAFCTKCGAYIADGSNVCPACGKRVGAPSDAEYGAGGAGGYARQESRAEEDSYARQEKRAEEKRANAERRRAGYRRSGERQSDGRSYSYNDGGEQYYSGGAGAGEYEAYDRGGNRYTPPYADTTPKIAVLAYFGILFIVPYFARPDSEFCRFHANQGLLLMLCGAISSALTNASALGWLVGQVGWGFTAVCFFIGVSNALRGRMRELPLIGRFRLLK